MARESAIGLDIGSSSVRAVELSFGRSGVTVERFGQVALAQGAVVDGEVVDPESVATAIRLLWNQVKFSSKRVVLGVANQRVIVRQVDLPWLPEAELRASLKHLVSDLVPMPVDEAVLDFVPIEDFVEGDGGRFVRGLLVAAAEEMVLASIEAVSRAGLTATSVDLAPFAILRSLVHRSDLGLVAGPEAIVDVGARITNIVVHEDGVPRFVRILLMGGQDVTDALKVHADLDMVAAEDAKRRVGLGGTGSLDDAQLTRVMMPAAAALVDEIRGSLDYYLATAGSRDALSRVVVTGGGMQLDGLVDRLAAAVRAPVVRGSALEGLKFGRTGLTPEQLEFVAPLVSLPVGLALGMAS
ncbi:MAG: type IV pilus assembly protein PilM [Actinomycetes bacterium]